jgi:hypothetical protein
MRFGGVSGDSELLEKKDRHTNNCDKHRDDERSAYAEVEKHSHHARRSPSQQNDRGLIASGKPDNPLEGHNAASQGRGREGRDVSDQKPLDEDLVQDPCGNQ